MVNFTDDLNFFENFLYEAPGDDPPDAPPEDAGGDTAPPDMPEGDGGNDPPDPGGEMSDDMGDDTPPDMGDDFSDDGMGEDPGGEDDGTEGTNKEPLELDDKISAVLNAGLYPQFLSMLNRINSQISMIKDNNDSLYVLAPDSLEKTLGSLKRLDENIRIYLNNYFNRENYSKNRLFFNMCRNLLKFLSDNFGQKVRQGAKSVE